jgi:uncharacterized protein YneF (UPF0154 family)
MLIDPQTLIIIVLAAILFGVLLGVYISRPRYYH